jgi:ATP-dependent Clp protease ATP-binding subunit ClpC
LSQLERYTAEGQKVLMRAREEAATLRHRIIEPEHLALSILKVGDPLIGSLFARLQADIARLEETLAYVVGRGNKAILSRPTFGQAARAVLLRAGEIAEQMSQPLIGIEHLLLGVLSDKNGIATGVMENFGVTFEAAQSELETLFNGQGQTALSTFYYRRYSETPTLNQVSRDLSLAALAGKLDPLIGREAELERTMQILARRSKNNPVLIGPAGAGKTAIAEGLALRIIEGRVPEHLQRCRVVTLDVGLLTAGTRFRGDFEERLKQIMQEIVKTKDLLIVIDELHALVGTGVAEGSIDAANLFKPMLARGEFRCIGATTLDDYRKTMEAEPALERRFQPVLINETTPEETLAIVRGLRERYADFHHVAISDDALVAAVQMSSRYVQGRQQPDKAIDLMDEAAARLRVRFSSMSDEVHHLRAELYAMQREKDGAIQRGDFTAAARLRRDERQVLQSLAEAEDAWLATREQERPVVDKQAIAAVVSMWTGIPVEQITGEEAARLLALEDELHQRVIGQHEAVEAVAKAIRRARTGIRDGHRPIGSFLFVGPTGVGKTELARALAVALFGDENALLKLDMSEFMEQHTASRLLGTPPGYVGYDQAGQLIEAVRRRPYSIVLFDEIEKAHPAIFDLLLQILEDGCLTGAQGHSASFRHTIIILTSNVGTAQLRQGQMTFAPLRRSESQVAAPASLRAQILPALNEVFRPELLNRFDEIIVFHPLSHAHLREIVDLLVAHTRQRIAEQAITLHVSEAARWLLVEQGYDPVYGARPLRRAVQRLLDDLLAESLLRGDMRAGDSVTVDAVDGQLRLEISREVSEPSEEPEQIKNRSRQIKNRSRMIAARHIP